MLFFYIYFAQVQHDEEQIVGYTLKNTEMYGYKKHSRQTL